MASTSSAFFIEPARGMPRPEASDFRSASSMAWRPPPFFFAAAGAASAALPLEPAGAGFSSVT